MNTATDLLELHSRRARYLHMLSLEPADMREMRAHLRAKRFLGNIEELIVRHETHGR